MSLPVRRIPLALSAMTLALLAACGGGGGGGGGGFGFIPPSSSGGGTTPPAASTTTLSGTAATGAPFAGAALTVFDQTGAKVCEVRTGDDGRYSCTLPAGTKAPLVIQAVRDDLVLYSTTASSATGTANVTPLTTVVVSRLAPGGDPAKLLEAVQANAGTVTAGTIGAQVKQLLDALQPLLSALGTTIDPIGGAFSADGTGQDRVLDTLSVSVRPDGSAASIEITVKSLPAGEDSAPVSLVFRSGDARIEPLPAIAAEAVQQPPTPQMVQALLERLNACYALPLAQRVNSTVNGDGNAYGDASNVVAPACRTLFVGDDPANFVSFGARIGRVESGARRSFESLFRAGPTNLKHDRGNFEYFYANGDVALTYRWTDVLGNTDNDVFNARIVGGALKLVGNENAYRASVRPHLDMKDFLKHQNLVFHSVGYTVSVDNRRDAQGNPLFSKVVATSTALPGRSLVLVPNGSITTLVLTADGSQGGTPLASPVWRMAAQYRDATQVGSPSDIDSGNLFAAPAFTDAQLAALPDQAVWRLEFFHVDPERPNVVQYARTFSRVPTIAEARAAALVELTPALRAELLEETRNTGRGLVFPAIDPNDPSSNNVDFSAAGNTDGWSVPSGAYAPISLGIFGRAPGNTVRYSENVTLRSNLRKVIAYCQPSGAQDTHCAPGTGSNRQYAQGTSISNFVFSARTPRLVDQRRSFELWTVTQP